MSKKQFTELREYETQEQKTNNLSTEDIKVLRKLKTTTMKTYKILYIEENEIHEWTLEEIIDYINADRSNEWTDYDKSDWKEGWNEWVKGEGYYKLIN